MRLNSSAIRCSLIGAAAALAVLSAAFVLWQQLGPGPVTVTVGQSPEELVYVRSDDDVVNGGAMFKPPKDSARQVAII